MPNEILFNEDLFMHVFEQEILAAEQSIWLATADLRNIVIPQRGGRTYNLADMLAEKVLKEGVRIRILHSSIPTKGFREGLRGYGGLADNHKFAVKRCLRMHMKGALIDHKKLYLGSANLTGAGLGAKSARRRNFEAGVITRNSSMLDAFAEMYDNVFQGGFCADCGLRGRECSVPMEEPDLR